MIQVYEYYILIRMLNKMIEEENTKMAQKVGLTHPQYFALAIIYYHNRLLVSEIARIGSWHISTTMNLISRLKEKKLIQLEPVEKGKGNEVILTELGKELAADFFFNSSEKIKRFYEAIGPEGFDNNLQKIYHILGEVMGHQVMEGIKVHIVKARKMANTVESGKIEDYGRG